MIVEVFDVCERGKAARGMKMEMRCAMCGERDMERFAQRRDFEQSGESAATGGVRLQTIDRARFQHAAKISWGITILAGGDLHSGRCAISQEP